MTTRSILQDWVVSLSLRYQGVLLTTVRGSDAWSKHSKEKPLVREMRGLILVPFDPRELERFGGFMTGFPHPEGELAFKHFCDNIDPMPIHYVMHVMHAAEILGYCHPSADVRRCYRARYMALCSKFHLNPETQDQMHARLTEDRIANGTVEL